MTANKEAARVLAHPNGQKRELSQTHKTILLHFVRFGKLFTKTCAVALAILGLAAIAGIAEGGGSAAVLVLIGSIAALNGACGAWFSLCEKEVALCAAF